MPMGRGRDNVVYCMESFQPPHESSQPLASTNHPSPIPSNGCTNLAKLNHVFINSNGIFRYLNTKDKV